MSYSAPAYVAETKENIPNLVVSQLLHEYATRFAVRSASFFVDVLVAKK